MKEREKFASFITVLGGGGGLIGVGVEPIPTTEKERGFLY
jgi:hypothetical protein